MLEGQTIFYSDQNLVAGDHGARMGEEHSVEKD
jgi:hypothetical protein